MADIRLKRYDVQDNVLFDIPVTKECEKVDELMKQRQAEKNRAKVSIFEGTPIKEQP